jgi:hypothetical protein
MTHDEIVRAKEFAAEWVREHPRDIAAKRSGSHRA